LISHTLGLDGGRHLPRRAAPERFQLSHNRGTALSICFYAIPDAKTAAHFCWNCSKRKLLQNGRLRCCMTGFRSS
jgi:hypothetical protein